MISDKLIKKINEQITFEFYSSHIYLSMAAKFATKDFIGASEFMKVQVEEERIHAMKLFDFLVEAGAEPIIEGFENPIINGDNILELFEESLCHEKIVTERIYELMDIAHEDKNYAAVNLINWFVDEQLEEESSFDTIIKKLKLIGNDGNGLYQLDKELGERVLTPQQSKN